MKNFESDDNKRLIIEGFKKADAFYARFKNDFSLSVMEIIKGKLNTNEHKSQLNDNVSIYAQEIINATESVIDKDRNYPEYRLKDELKRIRKVVSQIPTYEADNDFTNALNKQVKILMVNYFKDIFNLTANGFLLLEISATMHTLRFLTTYYNIVNKKISEL